MICSGRSVALNLTLLSSKEGGMLFFWQDGLEWRAVRDKLFTSKVFTGWK
ncbi:MAG: hypothetical protein JWR87_2554 [Segetibacter sp.]|nr:hypothetical protein [Segetibacter sp.]